MGSARGCFIDRGAQASNADGAGSRGAAGPPKEPVFDFLCVVVCVFFFVFVFLFVCVFFVVFFVVKVFVS